MGRSTRPVVFFNNNKMRYVVDITNMREYSGNVHLIEDARRVAGGKYSTNVLGAWRRRTRIYMPTSCTISSARPWTAPCSAPP